MVTYLILDCNYLCWRAFHSTGSLTHKGRSTGVIFGFLRDIVSLCEHFQTDHIAFCFDYSRKHLKRKKIYPTYKFRRDAGNYSPEEEREYWGVQLQAKQLRTEILPNLGYRNIFTTKGYEADDLIASIVHSLGKKEEAIIVSADQDLYQLLGPRVLIYNATTCQAVTEKSFSKIWGITPTQWIDVKAIAGCKGDDVAGIKGVREKTACKFLRGQLDTKSTAFQAIIKGNKIWKRNIRLVQLPFKGTPVMKLRKDKTNDKKWKRVCKQFGIRKLSTPRGCHG